MKWGDVEKRQEILQKKGLFLRFFTFFQALKELFDPKCYTWLESLATKDSYGKLPKKFRVTSKGAEFCYHFGSEIITPPETLSYFTTAPTVPFVTIVFIYLLTILEGCHPSSQGSQ